MSLKCVASDAASCYRCSVVFECVTCPAKTNEPIDRPANHQDAASRQWQRAGRFRLLRVKKTPRINDRGCLIRCIAYQYPILERDPFNGHLSRTTQVSRYQKGKNNLDFTEARDSEWQWHQLGHMQVCTSLQTDNHAGTPTTLVFFRPDALSAAQPTASKHWRQPKQYPVLLQLFISLYGSLFRILVEPI